MFRRRFIGFSLWLLAGVLPGQAQQFQHYLNYKTGSMPVSVAFGDFNRDGNGDLVTANYDNTEGTTVSVLLGNGDGTFRAPVYCRTGLAPVSVAVGDFNRDHKPDLAVANARNNTVSVLLGNGDGTFQMHVDYATGYFPSSIAAADFNRDGALDLVTANSFDNVNTMSLLLGNGDGTFQAYADYATGKGPGSIAVGDLNGGDGAVDVVTADVFNNTVSVLLNRGGTRTTTTSSNNPSHLNQPVTFTTTVTASLPGVGTPTGTVTFKDGATTLGSGTLVAGQATFTTSRLDVGVHLIRAKYSGDSVFNPHKAPPIIQKVAP